MKGAEAAGEPQQDRTSFWADRFEGRCPACVIGLLWSAPATERGGVTGFAAAEANA